MNRTKATLAVPLLLFALAAPVHGQSRSTEAPAFKAYRIGDSLPDRERFICTERPGVPPALRDKMPTELRAMLSGSECQLRSGEWETIAGMSVRSLDIELDGDYRIRKVNVEFPRKVFPLVLDAVRGRYGKETRVSYRTDGVPLYDWLSPAGTMRLMEDGGGNSLMLISGEQFAPAGLSPNRRASDL